VYRRKKYREKGREVDRTGENQGKRKEGKRKKKDFKKGKISNSGFGGGAEEKIERLSKTSTRGEKTQTNNKV